MANLVAKDKYRSILHDETENIQWRHGGPPTYDLVNQLFEEGRTKVRNHLSISPFSKFIYFFGTNVSIDSFYI
jgi:hypothetical protein